MTDVDKHLAGKADRRVQLSVALVNNFICISRQHFLTFWNYEVLGDGSARRLDRTTPEIKVRLRYGVYTAEGGLLSVWQTHAQASSFLHPGLEREVRPIGLKGLLPNIPAKQYERERYRVGRVVLYTVDADRQTQKNITERNGHNRA